jgi:hypothetical protein
MESKIVICPAADECPYMTCKHWVPHKYTDECNNGCSCENAYIKSCVSAETEEK